ncbi:MAG: hypothetical protein N3D09_03170 [Archaeoglobaceae archaeon]|nr:hypothetical protein [Archaeoglobaceae archaeon]
MELFVARKISKFSRVFKTRLPPFLLGFFLPFIWLPCIAPFLGIAISEAVLSERPLSISIFYILGFSTSVVVIIFLGRSLKINFEAIRKILGIAVLISTLCLILRQFRG